MAAILQSQLLLFVFCDYSTAHPGNDKLSLLFCTPLIWLHADVCHCAAAAGQMTATPYAKMPEGAYGAHMGVQEPQPQGMVRINTYQ